MPQQPKRQPPQNEVFVYDTFELPEDLQQAPPEDSDLLRTMLSTGVRVGSGLVGGTLSNVWGPGTIAGGAVGGAGEIAAQMIEKGTLDPREVNYGRVGLEAGLSAIPGLGFVKAGRKGLAALEGATLAGVGTAGRKYTSEDPVEQNQAFTPWNWSWGDIGTIGLGAGIGAGAAKVFGKKPAITPKAPPGSEDLDSALREWAKQDGVEAVEKATKTWDDVPTAKQTARVVLPQLRTEGKFLPVDEAVRGAPADIDAMYSRAKALGYDEYAEALRNRALEVGKSSKSMADAVVRGRAQDMLREAREEQRAKLEQVRQWVNESRTMKKAEKALKIREAEEKAKADLIAAEERIQRMLDEGGLQPNPPTVTDTTTFTQPDGTKTTGKQTFSVPKGEDGANSPAPPRPKKIDPRGKKKAAASPTDQPTVPGQSTLPLEPAAPITPAAQITPDVPTVPSAVQKATEPMPVEPVAPTVPPPAAASPVPATKVGEIPAVSEPTTSPTGLARFFRTPEKAAVATAKMGELKDNPEAADAIWNLWAQAEALNKVKGRRGAFVQDKTTRGPIMAKLREVQARFGITPGQAKASEAPTATQPPAPKSPPPTGTFGKTDTPPAIELPQGYSATLTKRLEALYKKRWQLDEAKGSMDPAIYAKAEEAIRKESNALQPLMTKEDLIKRKASGVPPSAPELPDAPRPTKGTGSFGKGSRGGKKPGPQTSPSDLGPPPDDSAPRLVKRPTDPNKGKGPKLKTGITLGSGLGGAQDILSMFQRNPEFSSQLVGGAVGATAGTTLNEDDPLKGALFGGLAGAGLGTAVSRSGGISQAAKNIATRGSNIQRAALLSDVYNLGINTAAAPFGAANMGSLEELLLGKATGNQDRVDTAKKAFGELWDTGKQSGRLLESSRRARAMLDGANERGEMRFGVEPNKFDKALMLPGQVMATGDMLQRSALEAAGMPEDLARQITVTANPRTSWGNQLVNMSKEPVWSLLMPFARTAVNVAESGLERTPILNEALYRPWLLDPSTATEFNENLARYGLGFGVGAISFAVGATVPPDTAERWRLNRLLSNMAGQYGLQAAAGFAAGAATQRPGAGRGGRTEVANAMFTEFMRSFPVPGWTPVTDTKNTALNWIEGKPAHPNAKWPFQKYLPNIVVPLQLRDKALDQASEIPDDIRNFYRSFELPED